jgi:hypothetical protein
MRGKKNKHKEGAESSGSNVGVWDVIKLYALTTRHHDKHTYKQGLYVSKSIGDP